MKEKSKKLEGLHSCLRITAIVFFIIGVYTILKDNSTPKQFSSKEQIFIGNLPYMGFGMSILFSLTMLILAYITRKESTMRAVILLAVGIVVPLLSWLIASSMSQPHLVPITQ